jgi:hypothetical protein
VEVTEHYKYLGVDLLTNIKDWSKYVKRTIAVATRVSSELGWLCRRETGLLPRTAASLWKAVARPLLEYAAELWSGDIPKKLVKRAEAVQTNFARSILGLVGCQSIAHDIIRAELGLEKDIVTLGEIKTGLLVENSSGLPRSYNLLCRSPAKMAS